MQEEKAGSKQSNETNYFSRQTEGFLYRMPAFPLLVFPGEPQSAPLLCVPQAAPPLPEAGAFTRMKRTPGLHHWEIVTLMKTLF